MRANVFDDTICPGALTVKTTPCGKCRCRCVALSRSRAAVASAADGDDDVDDDDDDDDLDIFFLRVSVHPLPSLD